MKKYFSKGKSTFLKGNSQAQRRNLSKNLIKTTELVKLISISDSKDIRSQAYRKALDKKHSEQWWHQFLQQHFLKMQQQYTGMISKLNITIGTTAIPDFILISKDGRLDVMEIKTPETMLTSSGRNGKNFAPSHAIASAVIQIQNYIRSLVLHGDALKRHLFEEYNLRIEIIQPRGIILAGKTTQFITSKQKQDFILFWESIHNVKIHLYDELPINSMQVY